MYGNQLNGALPEVSKLVELKSFSVLENMVTGELPESFCSLPKLEYLRVGGLNVVGTMHGGIPPCLFAHPNMKGIWLRNTGLGGAAPTQFPSNLVELGLQGNKLNWSLPAVDYSQFNFECSLRDNPFACPLPAGAADKCGATCVNSTELLVIV